MKVSKLVTGLAAAVSLLSGCAVVPFADPYYEPDVVVVAPPPPRSEYPGYPPVIGYVWVGGYWAWNGHGHYWVPGRWEAPRSGYRWVPHRWDRDGRYWRQHGGNWEPDRNVRIEPAPRHERELEREPAPVLRHERDPGPRYERERRGGFVPEAEARPEREVRSPMGRSGMQRDARPEGGTERSPRLEQNVRPDREQDGRRMERRERRDDSERRGRREGPDRDDKP